MANRTCYTSRAKQLLSAIVTRERTKFSSNASDGQRPQRRRSNGFAGLVASFSSLLERQHKGRHDYVRSPDLGGFRRDDSHPVANRKKSPSKKQACHTPGSPSPPADCLTICSDETLTKSASSLQRRQDRFLRVPFGIDPRKAY